MPKDDYGVHEALDRSECCASLVVDWLIEHPVIEARKDWFALAERAHEALFDLYQAIGREHWKY